MSNLWAILKSSLKSIWRRSGFTLTAGLTLTTGITASCLVFTLVEGVLLRPLPFPRDEEIFTLYQTDPGLGIEQGSVSPANFMDWKEQSHSFQYLAMVQPFGFDYFDGQEPREYSASLVSEGFFQVFGMPALLGRTLEPGDYSPDAPPVAVISQELWERDFGADPSLVGRQLRLDEVSRTIVGIVPAAFQVPPDEAFWAPRRLSEEDRRLRRRTFVRVVGRLGPGISGQAAQAEFNQIGSRLAQEYPEANAGVRVRLVPLYRSLVAGSRKGLLVLMAAVGFLLLIACANVGGLQLNQGVGRLRELGIRSALGATRCGLIMQLVTEGMMLAALSAVASLLLTENGLRLLLRWIPDALPRQNEIEVSSAVVLFAVGVALLSILLFSLTPALLLTRRDLFTTLRGGGRTSRSHQQRRFQSVFLTLQPAISMTLLFGGFLLFRSYLALESTDPGFQRSNLLALQVFPDLDPARTQGFYQEVLQRLEATPGVLGAAGVLSLPLSGQMSIELTPGFQIQGREELPVGRRPVTTLSVATPNYFRVMGIPLLEGRSFQPGDDAEAPVVGVINQTMARRFWPVGNPLGAKLSLDYGDGIELEVVGVVGDTRHEAVGREEGPRVYLPYQQGPSFTMTFVAHTVGPAENYFKAFKQTVWDSGYRRPIDRITTMEWLFSASIEEARFRAWVLALFSLLALLVVSIGLYSTISLGVRSRRREIGVRLALGASPGGIFSQVLAGNLRQLILGSALGLAGGFACAQLLQDLLYQVTPRDLGIFLGSLMTLFLVCLPAMLLPAHRASRTNPLEVLRQEE